MRLQQRTAPTPARSGALFPTRVGDSTAAKMHLWPTIQRVSSAATDEPGSGGAVGSKRFPNRVLRNSAAAQGVESTRHGGDLSRTSLPQHQTATVGRRANSTVVRATIDHTVATGAKVVASRSPALNRNPMMSASAPIGRLRIRGGVAGSRTSAYSVGVTRQRDQAISLRRQSSPPSTIPAMAALAIPTHQARLPVMNRI